jgi:CsoR family transcriptional regulator, copper-sensing transcriptional repressor
VQHALKRTGISDTMAASTATAAEACTMSTLADNATRTDLLNRLKRAEGQLRGIQRMIEEGQPCLDIASQMAAVRKALDSTYVRMTVCFMQQELQSRLHLDDQGEGELGTLLDEVQVLLGKVR